MKTLKLFAASLLITGAAQAQTNWSFDASHTKVAFTATHLMVTEVTGQFKVFDGKVVATKDDFSDSQIEFTVDVNSINTDNDARDKHLKSDDFFNAEKYPKMTFKGTSFKKINDKSYKLTGQLTIRDVTKTVTFDVIYNGTVKDPWGNTKAGFKLTGSINRTDYNLKWNAAIEAGGVVVSEKIDITCNVELAKQK